MRPQSSTDDPSRPAPLDAFRLRHRDSCGPCALRWSSGPGDFAPDGLSSEDFHDMARILESLARSMRREADRRWAERKRGDDVIRIEIHKASYERGKSDGEAGRISTVPPGIDGFSYYSGYVEGKAVLERTKCPLFVPDDCRKERG